MQVIKIDKEKAILKLTFGNIATISSSMGETFEMKILNFNERIGTDKENLTKLKIELNNVLFKMKYESD